MLERLGFCGQFALVPKPFGTLRLRRGCRIVTGTPFVIGWRDENVIAVKNGNQLEMLICWRERDNMSDRANESRDERIGGDFPR